jgi:hypothetical protein
MEEMFEATGSRGGLVVSISQCAPRNVLQNIVNLLVPEPQRRDRYEGKTLRENMLVSD